MPKETMICKVCGKEYVACRTPNLTGVFRWRDVACSVECGQVWLERIERSRCKPSNEHAEPTSENVPNEPQDPIEESTPEMETIPAQAVSLTLDEEDDSEIIE